MEGTTWKAWFGVIMYIEEMPFSFVRVILLLIILNFTRVRLLGLIDMVNVRSENSMVTLRGRFKSCTVGCFIGGLHLISPGTDGQYILSLANRLFSNTS